MRVLRHILIATDFSADAERACRIAADLARRYDARVRVVTVVEATRVYERIVKPVQTSIVSVEALQERAAQRLQTLTETGTLAGLAAETEVRTGRPFSEIVATAGERATDLIVVGTKASHGAARLLLGSTAERIVRKASLPVLVAKSDLPPQPKILTVPVDFSACSRRAAEEGIALARRWKARIVFLHVIEPVPQAYFWPADPAAIPMFPAEPGELEGEWTHFVAPLPLDGIQWEKRTLKGRAAEAITETAATNHSDLVVVGTHGAGPLVQMLLGSVAEHVVRDSPCCVMTIRPEASQFELP